jgi:phosphoglycolate phosphatase-like HAD superfamily hydrolase
VKLVVFDLDGTLARTDYIDGECFIRAFKETTCLRELNANWHEYEHVTDEGITRQIFTECFGRQPGPEEKERIVDRFLDLLTASHGADGSHFSEIPGAALFLQRVQEAEWAVAVATGAWRRSAEFKIQQASLPVRDLPSAFSEDGPSREAIVRTAIDRALERYRQERFERIISVGDALWDVKTARNLDLPFLGIASGTRASLLRHNGTSHVIEDYSDPDRCLQYLNEARTP